METVRDAKFSQLEVDYLVDFLARQAGRGEEVSIHDMLNALKDELQEASDSWGFRELTTETTESATETTTTTNQPETQPPTTFAAETTTPPSPSTTSVPSLTNSPTQPNPTTPQPTDAPPKGTPFPLAILQLTVSLIDDAVTAYLDLKILLKPIKFGVGLACPPCSLIFDGVE